MTMQGLAGRKEPDEQLNLKKMLASLACLPRVLRLVWSASPWLTLGLALFTLLQGITPLATVTLTGFLLNRVLAGIARHSFEPLWLPVILQLVVGLLSLLFLRSTMTMRQLLQTRVATYVQLLILHKTTTLDLAFFEDPTFYDTLREASSESAFRPMNMISQAFDMGRGAITLLSMLGLLFTLQWWLVLVALVLPIPSFIADTSYGIRTHLLMRRQSPERRLMAYYTHVMTVDDCQKEVKLFDLGAFFINRYLDLAERLYSQDKGLITRRNTAGTLWSALSVLANTAIYLYVALEAVLGHISIGALTQYMMAINQAGQNFQGLLTSISSTYENYLYITTLFEFLEYEPHLVSPSQPIPIAVSPESKGLDVEFRNVSFTYPGKRKAVLKQVSFTIQAGESIALVGRNGAGKTTLVKLLTRLYDPTEGEILIGGHNIKEYGLEELRAQIGVIFQDFVRYQMIARENIGLGRVNEIENQPLVALSAQKSGAAEVIERLSDGYETMLGAWFKGAKEEGTQLSGGEWQKIALARAFMRDARILVLDEPTSALDAQSEYDVFCRFRELTKGKTALFISHRFSTVRLADRIFVIEDGRIIETGSHTELLSLGGRYAELFQLQAEAYR